MRNRLGLHEFPGAGWPPPAAGGFASSYARQGSRDLNELTSRVEAHTQGCVVCSVVAVAGKSGCPGFVETAQEPQEPREPSATVYPAAQL